MTDYAFDISNPAKVDFGALAASVLHTPEDVEREAAAGALAQAWKIRTLADAYQKRDPMLFLVDGLLPCPSLSIVYGGPGSLKSMILADLAICVASGSKWLDLLPSDQVQPGRVFNVTQCPVLWIDFDNGTRRTDERIDAFARTRNLPVDTPIHYVSMPTPWLDASMRPMVEELGKLVKSLGVKLIIVDNLGLVTGDTEENSAAMAQVMGNLRLLCEDTESAVVVVHHQRKSNGNGDHGIRKGETLRGHSSIEAAVDLALLIERKPGEDSIAIIPTKVRGYKIIDILGAFFTYTHVEGTYDLATARFFSIATETETERELNSVKDAIRTVIKEAKKPMIQKGIVDATRDRIAAQNRTAPGINRVRGVLKMMVDDGELREVAGEKAEGNRAQFYDLLSNEGAFYGDDD